MGIDNYITDPKNHKNAHVVTHDDKDSNNALVVATHPLKKFDHAVKPFTNPLFGSAINVAVDFGTPTIIYAENAEWTTSAISGTWDFASTDFAQAGSVSVDATSTADNDIAQFDNGADLDLSDSVSITGWIYITRWDVIGTRGINITGWDTGTGLPVGKTVDLVNFIEIAVLNIWQQFSIVLSDMDLVGETIDSLRVTTTHTGGAQPPNYYLDTIQIETKGAIDPQTFAIKADLGTWLHVLDFAIFIANNDFDSTADGGVNNVTSPTLPNIPYDSLLGETLQVGLLYQFRRDDDIIFNHIIRDLSDFLFIPGATVGDYGCTGRTNTWMVLKSENNEQLCIIISEDLSGLDVLKSAANCKIERR